MDVGLALPSVMPRKNGTTRNGVDLRVESYILTSRNRFSHAYTCECYYIACRTGIHIVKKVERNKNTGFCRP